MRGAHDPVAGGLDRPREAQRRLPAELGDDALRPLAIEDGEHLLGRERLEVEPVGGVVVGRDRLGVAVDHHGLVAERPEGLDGVDAAVVELDALPDPIRPRAEDHDPRLTAGSSASSSSPAGGVVVVRARPRPRRRTSRRGDRPGGCPAHSARADLFAATCPRPRRSSRRPSRPAWRARCRADASSRRAPSSCSRNHGCTPSGMSSNVAHGVGAPGSQLARPERLEERLREGSSDAHRLAHGLHLRAEGRVGAGELLEGEPRELDDDVVERRLEARRRRLGEVVRDLVERVADRELRGDLRDRIPGGLRGERRGARDARVHLDDADLAGLAGSGRTGCSTRRSRRRRRG